jgi:hypothetical protein
MNMKSGNKGAGGSAGKHSRYIMRTGPYEDDKGELIFTHSANMPDFARTPAAFWDAADEYERANGTVYREIEVALPEELTLDEQIALANEFADKVSHTSDGETPWTMAIHSQDKTNLNKRHAHIMFSDRVVNGSYEKPADVFFKRYNAKFPENGGARKTEERRAGRKVIEPMAGEFDKLNWTDSVRPLWQNYANDALERSGSDERIDCRSLETQAAEAKETALEALNARDVEAWQLAMRNVIRFTGPAEPKKGPVLTHAGAVKAPDRSAMVINFETEKAKRKAQAKAELQALVDAERAKEEANKLKDTATTAAAPETNVLPLNVPSVLDFLKKRSNINGDVSMTDAKTTGTGTGTHGIRRVKF